MNLATFKISMIEVAETLKLFELFRMKGIKSINDDGVSEEFKSASIQDDYFKAYLAGLNNYDYDFLLQDQSYFQFEFQKTEQFIETRYAFFQNPITYISYSEYVRKELENMNLEWTEEDIGATLDDEYNQYLNEQELKSNYTTIRYDSDLPNYRPLIHAVSHLHIGHLNNVRIPLDKVISPLKFALFTIKHVYYQEWKKIVDGQLNTLQERLLTSKHGELLLDEEMWRELERLEIFLK
jgi:hypothetical protein